MAYILDTGAVLRLLALRDGDELLEWIEAGAIRPLIAPVTMGSARESFQSAGSLSPAQRATYEQRFDILLRDLSRGEENSVIATDLDYNGARILSDILLVATADGIEVNTLDLVPAAIAIQHNHEIVALDDDGQMALLAAALPPEIGRLILRTFEPLA
ncbi:hypothetical protein D2T29_21040 [Sinirhodobacter populi]|uniref:PIN domain-containing protein n=1 Tax=Paenirhodobacter populi TaxID=2306993 RepID=A0A443JZD7_9RHOB|nr:hypothetical protein [Sinirhodobacter populi]RWR09186.1 hypothetical protein D2T33_14400 [Sinirhodobacter populi]RWR25892.1 hypothetical protein D2T31_21445 [Sinirhodobacter populi]RWR26209.1 hypothetical protein D2T29_21040 [Sinirhodobacter populi]